MHGDPTTVVAEDCDDEIDVDTVAATHTCPPPPSLRAMMETVMMTQVAHGQILDGLLAKVIALRANLVDYRCPVPLSPPSYS